MALAIEAAPGPLHAETAVECEKFDVLRGFALSGRGVAWLPDCSLSPDTALCSARWTTANGAWTCPPSFSATAPKRRPAVDRLWSRLADFLTSQGADP